MSTQHQERISVAVEHPRLPGGVLALGTFDTISGVESDSDPQVHFAGGMGPQSSYGSRTTHGAWTVGRVYELDRDHEPTRTLTPLIGAAMITITRQPLDIDGATYGNKKTGRGRLKTISEPDGDSDSDDISMWELTAVITSRT